MDNGETMPIVVIVYRWKGFVIAKIALGKDAKNRMT